MTTREMYAIVQKQLAIDLNCTVEDLNGEKDSIVFTEAADHSGQRALKRGAQVLEMITMGNALIVSATSARLAYVKEQLAGKKRDEAFCMPFVSGVGVSCLPDLDRLGHIPAPQGFSYEIYEPDEIPVLLALPGFTFALQHDPDHPARNALAMAARRGDTVAAIAGAHNWCPSMWAIGMDVLPEYRCRGLAAYLTNALTHEILRRGLVPVYGYDASNIASQRVAHRAGFQPAWAQQRWNHFEGELAN